MTESLVALIAVVCVLAFWLIVMGIGLVQYILTSLALYTIADRRGIKNPWLAWLPVAYYWLLGSIADNYDETHGINRSWRKTLLILALIFIGGFTLCYAALFVFIILTSINAAAAETLATPFVVGFFVVYFALIAIFLVAGALAVLSQICYFKVFESTVPEKAVKYMLISLLVPLGSAICLYKCRYSGYGRPKNYIPEFFTPAPVTATTPAQPADAAQTNPENTDNTEL